MNKLNKHARSLPELNFKNKALVAVDLRSAEFPLLQQLTCGQDVQTCHCLTVHFIKLQPLSCLSSDCPDPEHHTGTTWSCLCDFLLSFIVVYIRLFTNQFMLL